MMSNKTILQQAEMAFGPSVGHLPEIWPGWDGPPAHAFWADSRQWNSFQLSQRTGFPIRFYGPFRQGAFPFAVPGDGYSVIILDKDVD